MRSCILLRLSHDWLYNVLFSIDVRFLEVIRAYDETQTRFIFEF